MDFKTWIEIVNQDLERTRTKQTSQRRSEDESLHIDRDIKIFERMLIILCIMKKMDQDLVERYKLMEKVVSGQFVADYYTKARGDYVEALLHLAKKTRCTILKCSIMNIQDEVKKSEALETNSDDRVFSSYIRSATQHLKSAEKNVKSVLSQTERLEAIDQWCSSNVQSLLHRFLE